MALRDELTATPRERIWLSIGVPYLSGVSRRLHWTILGLALALGVGIGAADLDRELLEHRPGRGHADARDHEPGARPGRSPQRRGSRFHPDRPVRQARLVALAARQGRGPLVQRPEVHHHLPAHDDRPAPRKEAPRAGELARRANRGRRQPGGDAGQVGAGVFARPRDAAQVALPDRLAAGAETRLARVRHRCGRHGRLRRPHPGDLRDRPERPGVPALPDRDGVLERRPTRVRDRAEHRGGCCPADRTSKARPRLPSRFSTARATA